MMPQSSFQVKQLTTADNYAQLAIEPLEAGYGHTLGNALRRVLLTSLPGYAIADVRVEGVNHQFTTISGVSEDVVELILNLKQVRFRSDLKHGGKCRINVSGKNKTEVTAADIECEAGFEVVNKDTHIATIDPKSNLKIDLTIDYSIGYSLSTERKSETTGVIPVDALYSPVVKVSYDVEATRVGRRTDFDRLLMNIWVDGSITAEEALVQAAEILVSQFKQIINPVVMEEKTTQTIISPEKAEVLRLTVEELDLPTRIANALRKGGYETVGDLVKVEKGIVAKVKNLGDKSVDIVQVALHEKGVDFIG